MASLVNVQDYESLCGMSFKDIAAMTSQLSALDGGDNFNYIMALQDICSRIDSQKAGSNRNSFRPRRRRRKRKRPIKKKQDSGWINWYFWDVFGLFSGIVIENLGGHFESIFGKFRFVRKLWAVFFC